MKSPLVSIIMNCYNGEKYLKQSLNSVLSQSYKNWELIFWDNISTDNSKKILKSFGNKRFKYFKAKKFTSLYQARKLAISKAKGKYICFLDTDDIWLKNKLKFQIELFKKDKNLGVIYSNYYIFYSKKKIKKIAYKSKLPSGNITQQLLNIYTLGIGTVIVERKIFFKNNFNKIYNVIGDFDFFVKVSLKNKIYAIQQPLVLYRIHGDNYSKKNMKDYIEELNTWIKKNKKNYESLGFDLFQRKIFLLKIKFKYYLNTIFNLGV